MEPGTFLIFLVIFGIIGFITEKIWGLNPYKIYSDIGALVLVTGVMFVMFPAIIHPEDLDGNINRIVTFFTNILPGAVIGDIAGSIISKITGGGR